MCLSVCAMVYIHIIEGRHNECVGCLEAEQSVLSQSVHYWKVRRYSILVL